MNRQIVHTSAQGATYPISSDSTAPAHVLDGRGELPALAWQMAAASRSSLDAAPRT